jgi:hypothetical protein
MTAFDLHTVWCSLLTMWHKTTLNVSKFRSLRKNFLEPHKILLAPLLLSLSAVLQMFI